jgi:hypothetical protein
MSPPTSKISRAKWTGATAQVLAHMLYKGKTLSSNHNTTQKLNVYPSLKSFCDKRRTTVESLPQKTKFFNRFWKLGVGYC